MISLVICTRDANVLAAFSQSVAETVGVAYEVVAVDNSHGKYGICEAYNLGAARAQYELLCFVHEDIRFHTSGWGKVVAEVLADQTVGVLGVTGGMQQVAAPAAWWGCGLEWCRENVLNAFADGHTEMELRNPEGAELLDVAVVDGMWLCCRRAVWAHSPFDAQTFTDFHFYDVDFCTEVFRQGLRVCVTFRVLLEHHSRGSVNDAWVRNALKYQRKRRGQLPFGPATIPPTEQRRIELKAMQEFTGRLIRGAFPRGLAAGYLARCWRLAPCNRDTWWLARQWLRAGTGPNR